MSSARRFALAATAIIVPLAVSVARAAQLPPYTPNEVLIRFDGSADRPTRAAADAIARFGLIDPEPVFPPHIANARPARNALPAWTRYRFATGASPTAIADSLSAIPGVTAQPNHLFRFLDTPAAPNDPKWPDQWAVRRIGLDKVWQQIRAASRDSVIIGVIDSGVDYTIPDLAGRIWHNLAEVNGRPGVDDDGNGYVDDTIGWDFVDAPDLPGKGDYTKRDNNPMDEDGHGTFVASIIAGQIDNGIGCAGISPTAKIMILRAGADLVTGGSFLQEDDIAAALVYAVDNGAQVVNMSFGGDVNSALMQDVIAYADDAGLVLVAASGNDAASHLLYPAAYNQTISVGATDDQDSVAAYSNRGENLDLVAPGEYVWADGMGGGVGVTNGTSMAAPHVSAAAAIVLSLAPDLTATQVRSLLRGGVTDLGAPGWDPDYGYGRLDLPTLIAETTGPIADILAPLRPAGADTAVRWSVHVAGAPPVAWSVTYGIGETPRVWTSLASGVLSMPSDTIRGSFATAALTEGPYALRLTATDALGKTSETRTIVQVDHTPPRFVEEPKVLRRWYDDYEELFLEWSTDDATSGTLEIWTTGDTSGVPDVIHPLDSGGSDHFTQLTTDLTGHGTFTARVRATNAAGLETDSAPVTASHEPLSVPTDTWRSFASLPAGVLMPGTVDLNHDGLPDLLVKRASRAPYDTVSVFEVHPSGHVDSLFDIPVQMRPSAVADLDGDGLLDLVGYTSVGTSFSVVVAGQTSPSSPPDQVWWTGSDLLAPTVNDLDGGGTPFLIALDDSNRTVLHVFRATGTHQLAEIAELRSPIDGAEGRFGIWRAVGDVTGDGTVDVVAGTVGGSVVIFTKPTVTPGSPVVIPGTGDATRVWGGTDVNGDGVGDFAVLRYYDSSEFDVTQRYWRLDLYAGPDAHIIASREFADPRTDGDGFAAGDIGPDEAPSLAMAVPPRLYVFTPSSTGAAGFTWFAPTASPSQPLVAQLDATGGPELVVPQTDSIRVFRHVGPNDAPAAPTNVRVAVADSQAVDVSWSAVPGMSYRVWTGDQPSILAPRPGDATPPVHISSLPDGTPIWTSVQAIDRTRPDSLGTLSEPVSATPHVGPHVLSATAVAADRVIVTFDAALDKASTGTQDFAVLGSDRVAATSVIRDRGGSRVVLAFPDGTVDPAVGATLAYVVRDTSGAVRNGTVAVVPGPDVGKPGIAYAFQTAADQVAVGFTEPVDPASFTPGAMTFVPARVPTVVAAGQDGRTFDVQFASALVGDSTFVMTVTGVRTTAGREFNAGAVIANTLPSSSPGIVAVLQKSSTELWIVANTALPADSIGADGVLVTPRVTVTSVSQGPTTDVLVVDLDAGTPVGPWVPSYSVGVNLPGGREYTATWTPLSQHPDTGHLRSVAALNRHDLRLSFDVPIAASQPDSAAVSVEPGIDVTSYTVADTTVEVTLSDHTPVGPWGTTYFVRVEGLMSAGGERLSELYALRIAPRAGLDSVLVFPQPFRPAMDATMRFGGLPEGADVRIYSLDGSLVRVLPTVNTGGSTWDGRNDAGVPVRSGIYLYVIDSPVGRKAGKLALIR